MSTTPDRENAQPQPQTSAPDVEPAPAAPRRTVRERVSARPFLAAGLSAAVAAVVVGGAGFAIGHAVADDGPEHHQELWGEAGGRSQDGPQLPGDDQGGRPGHGPQGGPGGDRDGDRGGDRGGDGSGSMEHRSGDEGRGGSDDDRDDRRHRGDGPAQDDAEQSPEQDGTADEGDARAEN
ncbi:hypothetical protein [Actinotalea sp. JY-7876]|uniref:hypothetical protein n=1 Tax=Actinotalea sp. JY-7876 TaxID=2758442 RepID=UPI0015F6022A|nr:hypothetical protein [Actinotalea sp. JY-7876]